MEASPWSLATMLRVPAKARQSAAAPQVNVATTAPLSGSQTLSIWSSEEEIALRLSVETISLHRIPAN